MSLFGTEKLDLKNSLLTLEGSKKEQDEWHKKIKGTIENLEKERKDRETVLRKRNDFYIGKQHAYTNIVGKSAKNKVGTANAVFNYAGKSVTKIGYSLANNPPTITIPANKIDEEYLQLERVRAQGVEDFITEVFKLNRFWKGGYRRACFNQVLGDGALKVYPMNVGTPEEPVWELKIVSHEKMENLMVAWRSDDPTRHDAVVASSWMSSDSIEREFGIKVPEKVLGKLTKQQQDSKGTHVDGKEYDTAHDFDVAYQANTPPSGETNIPTIRVDEYDSEEVYAIEIGGELVQLIFKDGEEYPSISFWIIVPNIPNPGKSWSVSDIDYMMDPQVEFNEASNEERNYIRVGANQKFVAYNMDEFDPQSIKTGSGQVIFVNSPDGSARFEPLSTNVNVFPIDAYLNRVQQSMYDLGIPKVTFGAGGADSGRSKAIDFQSLVDLTIFKRDSWEWTFDQLTEKIQILGDFYFPDINIFKDPQTNTFVVRHPEFDWSEVAPITQTDKIVNVLNKVTMGLPFRIAFKELGYRDVDQIIQAMKEEAEDEDLMMFRSKMYQVSGGLVGAQVRAQQVLSELNQQPPAVPGAPDVNSPTPVLQNQGSEGGARPVSQRGGTTSFSSPRGFIDRTRQNLQAQGR